MDKEVEAITLAATSDLPSRKIGGKASARVVKLRNPKIITTENKIEILGPVFLVSVGELKKAIKNRYKTRDRIFSQRSLMISFSAAVKKP